MRFKSATVRHLRATAGALLATSVVAGPVAAADVSNDSVQWVIARAQIEDTLARYYALFSARADSDFGAYYTRDGVLDANGVVARGKDAINKLYKGIGEQGNTNVVLSNLRIDVKTDSATVDLIWTEVLSANHLAPPVIVEQGHEHDELIRQSGHWLFTRRLVTNDGGLPPVLEKTYKSR